MKNPFKTLDPYDVLRDAAEAGQEGYNNSPQMYEDFRALFFTSPQGKRVFHQIMTWAGFHRTPLIKGDPYGTHVQIGEKNIAVRLWAACIKEPVARPTKQKRG